MGVVSSQEQKEILQPRVTSARHFKRTVLAVRRMMPEPEKFVDHSFALFGQLHVVVRKRPLLAHEARKNEYDIVTCRNPLCVVHDGRVEPNGRSKYMTNHIFPFDRVLPEDSSSEMLYHLSVLPLIRKTFLAYTPSTLLFYGQRGSGKTVTLTDTARLISADVFRMLKLKKLDRKYTVFFSAFEVDGEKCRDLNALRRNVVIREDGAHGAIEVPVFNPAQLFEAMEGIVTARKEMDEAHGTHAFFYITVRANPTASCLPCFGSSRSTAVSPTGGPRDGPSLGRMHTRLTIADLSPCPRVQQTEDGKEAEVSPVATSLLHLQKCFRLCAAAAAGSTTAEAPPYSRSLLTRVLKDCFVDGPSRQVATFIATVSPLPSETEKTVHTLEHVCLLKIPPIDGEADEIGSVLRKERIEVSEYHSPSTRSIVVAEETKESSKGPKSPVEWTEPEVKEWLNEMSLPKPEVKRVMGNFNGLIGRDLCSMSVEGWVERCGGDTGLGNSLFTALVAIQKHSDRSRSNSPLPRTSSQSSLPGTESGAGTGLTSTAFPGADSGSTAGTGGGIGGVVPSPTPKRASDRGASFVE